jgi:hypothetical protein
MTSVKTATIDARPTAKADKSERNIATPSTGGNVGVHRDGDRPSAVRPSLLCDRHRSVFGTVLKRKPLFQSYLRIHSLLTFATQTSIFLPGT